MFLKRLRLGSILLLITSLFIAIPSFPDSSSGESHNDEMLSNLVIIKFKDHLGNRNNKIHTDRSDLNEFLIKHSVTSLQPVVKGNGIVKANKEIYDLSRIYYASFSGNRSPKELAKILETNPLIDYAEPKYISYLCATPNDSLYHIQKDYYDIIRATDIWDAVHGEDSEIIIAVVDAGTDINHSDLADNIWSNQKEVDGLAGVDDDENGYVDDYYGWNFSNEGGDPTGSDSLPFNADHGTYISGIVSAVSNNNSGVSGTSWNAKVMSINAASASEDGLILYGYEGILYAAQNGADVINCSWVGFKKSKFGKDVVNFATSVGAVVVGAAGNDGTNSQLFPASFDNVISVAATDTSDHLWRESNYGSFVDLAAPGTGIFSTMAWERFGYADGTSAAAAIVSGSVGLMRVLNPQWNETQIKQHLKITADSHNFDSNQVSGGRINLYRAITEEPVLVEIMDYTFLDANGNNLIENGEHVDLGIQLLNHLAPISNITATLSSSSEFITFIKDKISISSIGTLEYYTTDDSFRFVVDKDIPNKISLNFDLKIETNGYQNQQSITIINSISQSGYHKDADKYILFDNYPNPFNSSTSIKFRLAEPTWASIIVFNDTGQEVRTLNDSFYTAGVYSLEWDGRDQSGKSVASGIYYLMIRTKNFKSTKKMMLIK